MTFDIQGKKKKIDYTLRLRFQTRPVSNPSPLKYSYLLTHHGKESFLRSYPFLS